MKKILFISLLISSVLSASAQKTSIYDYTVKTIDGKDFSFAALSGKKVLIVNTASKCGFTPQYEDLQKLWLQYGGDDFVIVGFPSNDFMNQEPGSDEEIKTFCTENYGVTFPMMSKISVKGDNMHPLYKWLTFKDMNGVEDSKVQWNFQKYLIDEHGKLAKVVKPKVKPFDKDIIDWLNKK